MNEAVFVAVFIQIGDLLSRNVSWLGIGQVVVLFVPLWWVWANFTWYMNQFQIDDVWHRIFGQDVTLWSPPHIQMVFGASLCTVAMWILYVEAVDPDGDGDAHFVLLSSQSVTGPGISVIDVGRDLRPDPLPGIGDEISAAGPVYRGSYGQRQIQAEELHVARR